METLTVEALMADLDTHIAGELSVLQARGANRNQIELRHKELCDWAMAQCAHAELARPIDLYPVLLTDEMATVRSMWAFLLPEVTKAIKAGLTVEYIAVVRAEDGMTVIMHVDFAEPEDPMIWATSDFYKHFDPEIWADALECIAVDFNAGVEVADCFPEALADAIEPAGPWRRMF
ncbi:hypothetical protein EOD10_19430 [Mesorhizobium sp. M7A.T.Ca.TU.009.01.3.2]|nr:hypothetical protein EOD10_19430 [Mesorhizobium sp. M7A.T.Ca.TU.009.01.3.2]RUU95158.1 hypothetical protein EOD00_26490 [Mesorhizobium sp. M7A.T.Ca.TU.009.01.3.1]